MVGIFQQIHNFVCFLDQMELILVNFFLQTTLISVEIYSEKKRFKIGNNFSDRCLTPPLPNWRGLGPFSDDFVGCRLKVKPGKNQNYIISHSWLEEGYIC